MAMFNCYVSSPEGILFPWEPSVEPSQEDPDEAEEKFEEKDDQRGQHRKTSMDYNNHIYSHI